MKTLAGGNTKPTLPGGQFVKSGTTNSTTHNRGTVPHFITGPNIKGPNPLQELQPSVMRYVRR